MYWVRLLLIQPPRVLPREVLLKRSQVAQKFRNLFQRQSRFAPAIEEKDVIMPNRS